MDEDESATDCSSFIRNRHQEGYEEGKADGSQSAKSEAAKKLHAMMKLRKISLRKKLQLFF
ncbi:MAG: hypothetical protein IJ688_11405 [Treponema sp.]|nr:hypothetical protein [Treponema sp.]